MAIEVNVESVGGSGKGSAILPYKKWCENFELLFEYHLFKRKKKSINKGVYI